MNRQGSNGNDGRKGTPSRFPPAKVMLFTDTFNLGGTERQMVQSLRLLDRSKYQLLAGCMRRTGPFLSEVEAMGIPVVEWRIPSLGSVRCLIQMVKLARFLRRERVDLVHAFDYYTDLFAVPAARLAGVPVVLASRRSLADDRNTAERMALGLACRMAHATVANSRLAGRIAAGPPEKVHIIPNSIDLDGFRIEPLGPHRRKLLGLPDDAKQELWVGVLARLSPEKGHRTFLRAAARVAASCPQARFVLIGDGPDQLALETLGRQLGLGDHVRFAGNQRDVAQWLGALDVAVLPSDFESLPNALLEAMAAGLPVVATHVGGVPEVVEENVTAFTVAPGDHEAMAQRILTLLSDEGLRRKMGAAGRARIERDFTPARMKASLEALYDKMLRERRPVARILQIGNFPPPVCGWSLHTQLVHQNLLAHGADSRVLDIGPGRLVEGRDCLPVKGGGDYARKLLAHRLRGFTFHVHVNGDSWKGYLLALSAVLLGRATGKPAVLTFHAGPSQKYFPRQRGIWRHAFRLLFFASGEVVCNHEPVKAAIESYGIPAAKVHPIPAYSVQYAEEIPAPLPEAVEEFLRAHEPRLFSYTLFRPEFTIEALWDALAALRQRYPRAGLLLAGPKETPEEVSETLRRGGLASSVLISGNLPHAQFLTALQRCDVFVRTHLRDGVCASVLEALSLGVPVVASEDGLRPPSVVTYLPGDARALTRQLEMVLADLPAFRRQVHLPQVEDNLDREVALLLRAGSEAHP